MTDQEKQELAEDIIDVIGRFFNGSDEQLIKNHHNIKQILVALTQSIPTKREDLNQ